MDLVVNGVGHSLDLDLRTTLLDALREQLHRTGGWWAHLG
jgi:aerobic-type carbon monoxide dehydrogenase small subunit (CoxS/CutS family)